MRLQTLLYSLLSLLFSSLILGVGALLLFVYALPQLCEKIFITFIAEAPLLRFGCGLVVLSAILFALFLSLFKRGILVFHRGERKEKTYTNCIKETAYKAVFPFFSKNFQLWIHALGSQHIELLIHAPFVPLEERRELLEELEKRVEKALRTVLARNEKIFLNIQFKKEKKVSLLLPLSS